MSRQAVLLGQLRLGFIMPPGRIEYHDSNGDVVITHAFVQKETRASRLSSRLLEFVFVRLHRGSDNKYLVFGTWYRTGHLHLTTCPATSPQKNVSTNIRMCFIK